LTDQVILTSIAKNDADSHVRSKAVQTLTEQSVLIDFAKNDMDSQIRRSAINNLSNKSVLENISKNDSEDFIRKAANEKLASISLYNSDDIEIFSHPGTHGLENRLALRVTRVRISYPPPK